MSQHADQELVAGLFAAMGVANIYVSWKIMRKITAAVLKEYPGMKPWKIAVDVVGFLGTLQTISTIEKITIKTILVGLLTKYANETM